MLVYALFKSGLEGLCGSHCSVACIKCHIISIHANKLLIGFDMDCALGITVCANHFLQIYNIFVSLPWLVLDNVLRGLTALIYWNKRWKLHCYLNVKCLYCITCAVSQVPVTLVIFMHGGGVKLFHSPCAFMLNYAFSGSAISGWNTVSPLLKIRWLFFWCQEPTGQIWWSNASVY